MYVGRIPYAFEEEQQFQYFSQFGKVLNVRLSKNPKTGKNRGHGWVLWDDYDVGQQVAEYMDGYYMYGKTLHVNMVPKSVPIPSPPPKRRSAKHFSHFCCNTARFPK